VPDKMSLSTLFCSIQNALTTTGWQSVIEDDYPDLKLIVCENPLGPFDIFTRLDVIIMTPELNPVNASGTCLCFLFYADPSKVVDMRKLGKTIRQNDAQPLRIRCESMLNSSGIILGNPTIKILTRPKHEKIRFNDKNFSYPAFMVEFDYWMPREEKEV
jgi:hypothetical protein